MQSLGRADVRLIEAAREVIAEQTDASTGTPVTADAAGGQTGRGDPRAGSGSAARAHHVLPTGGPACGRQTHVRVRGDASADGEPAGRSVHSNVRRPAG